MIIESSKHQFEEITIPTAESLIILQKVNAHIIEFNHQGSLVAIGCKYGIVLIFDILSKEIVRYFNIYMDAELSDEEANAKSFEQKCAHM